MTEQPVLRRKSQLFLNNISPVTNTFDELVKEKLEPGKFPVTVTGILKMFGMVILLFSISFFLAAPKCLNASKWYPYLLPISLGVTLVVQLCLFTIFSTGMTVQKPGFWIYSDILIILSLSIVSVTTSVVTYTSCADDGSLIKVAGPFGIVGAIILIVSCGAILMMYRYLEDEENPELVTSANRTIPRKSVFA